MPEQLTHRGMIKLKTKFKQMKNILLKVGTKIPLINSRVKKYRFSQQFKTEIKLLKNEDIEITSQQPSIIHFSVNKAATQYVKNILQKIAIENEIIPVSINDYAFGSDLPFFDHLDHEQMSKYKRAFKEKGVLYSVFGGFVENIDNLRNYKIVFTIRDPRDILVSDYFSKAFNHPEPPKLCNKRQKFLDERVLARSISIDEYVLKEADKVYKIFERYISNIKDYDNVKVLKYENMITNYENWLDDLATGAGLNLSDTLKEILVYNHQRKKIKKENKHKHDRKGVAGDYKEKLNKETIHILNKEFEKILSIYNYSV